MLINFEPKMKEWLALRESKKTIGKFKSYLVKDKTSWEICHLSFFEYLTRCLFGCFKNTHSDTLMRNLKNVFLSENSEFLSPEATDAAKKLDMIFKKKVYLNHPVPNDFLEKYLFSGIHFQKILGETFKKIDSSLGKSFAETGEFTLISFEDLAKTKFPSLIDSCTAALKSYSQKKWISLSKESELKNSDDTKVFFKIGKGNYVLHIQQTKDFISKNPKLMISNKKE